MVNPHLQWLNDLVTSPVVTSPVAGHRGDNSCHASLAALQWICVRVLEREGRGSQGWETRDAMDGMISMGFSSDWILWEIPMMNIMINIMALPIERIFGISISMIFLLDSIGFLWHFDGTNIELRARSAGMVTTTTKNCQNFQALIHSQVWGRQAVCLKFASQCCPAALLRLDRQMINDVDEMEPGVALLSIKQADMNTNT